MNSDIRCLGALAGVLVVPELLQAAGEAHKALVGTNDPKLQKLAGSLQAYDESVGLAVEILLASPATRRKLKKMLRNARKKPKKTSVLLVKTKAELADLCNNRDVTVRQLPNKRCCILSVDAKPIAAVKIDDLLTWACN